MKIYKQFPAEFVKLSVLLYIWLGLHRRCYYYYYYYYYCCCFVSFSQKPV